MPARRPRKKYAPRVPDADTDSAARGRDGVAADRRIAWAITAGLVLAVVAVFGRAAWFEFTGYDDPLYVTENPWVLAGLTPGGAAWALTTDRGFTWVPLTWLSLMLDAELHGSRAGGYHLTNVLLHAASAAGLFLLLRGATGRTWPAAIAAAIFAVHPLRVEAVAWVTARKDVLSGACFLLTLWAYGWYARSPSSPMRYAAIVTALALGLAAKSMLVTTPVLLLLIDYWPLGRLRESGNLPRLVLEKLPLLAVSLAAAAITVAAQGEALVAERHMTPAWRLAQATLAYVGYVGMFIWPANLAAAYPRRGPVVPWIAVAVAAALLLAITLAAWRERRRFPYLIVGWLWYLVAFLPAIGLVQIGNFTMADRFTYLPLLGPVVGLVWLAADVFDGEARTGRRRSRAGLPASPSAESSPPRLTAAALLAGGFVASLAVASYDQTKVWRDSETLWRRTLERTTNNSFAHLSLAAALMKERRYAEAEAHTRRALDIAPAVTLGLGQMAGIAEATGRRDEALEICRRVVAIDPRDARVRNLLGSLLSRQARHREALEQYRAALAVTPDSVAAIVGASEAQLGCDEPQQALDTILSGRRMWPEHPLVARQLGRVLLATGRAREAVESLRSAVDHDAADGAAWNALGVALGQSGRLEESAAALRRAVETEPGATGFHRDLGFALRESRRYGEAAASYRRAVSLDPENGVATNDLAWLLATCPDPAVRSGAEAVTLAVAASRIAGRDEPTVLDTLAAAHAEAGNFAEAITVGRQALEAAERRGEAGLAAGVRAHLALFTDRKAVRDPPEGPR